MRSAIVVVVAVLTLGVGFAPAATPKRANLASIARELVKSGAPGAVVYVRTPAGARAGVAGYANRSAHVSMRASDRYRIASVTKAFVSVVALQLEAEGKLDIDDPVAKYLPGVVPNGSAISLRELMNHTSGLFNYTDDAAFVSDPITNFSRPWTPQELLALAFAHPPNFAHGTNWSYSNTNYIVLGLVVEAVTGKPLGQVLQERLFTPLALTPTAGTYGLGIVNTSPACGRAFTHEGDFLGWQNIAYSTANGRRQAVVMVNVNYADNDRLVTLAEKALCRG